MSKYKKNKQPEAPRAKTPEPQKVPAFTNPVPTAAGNARQLIEQKRAQYALLAINDAILQSKDGTAYQLTELKAYIRRFPGMVQMNGFGQAVAFYYSKRNSSQAYGAVYQLVEKWLCSSGQIYSTQQYNGPHALLTAITSKDQNSYRAAQAETQALMLWVKKFADALILSPAEINTD
jgi:CRISPR-associated protein Cmr5